MEGDEEKKKWHKKKKKRSGGSRNRERWREVNALGAPMQWTPELDRDLRRRVPKVTTVKVHTRFMPMDYKPQSMRRYWVPVNGFESVTDYDEAKHGVVIFISHTPFLGPHPVLVCAIFRQDAEEVASMCTIRCHAAHYAIL